MDYKLPDAPKDEQIALLRSQIVLFSILQYLMPGIMLALAYYLPHLNVPEKTQLYAVPIICFFALMDFALLRFVVLRLAQKKLNELEGNTPTNSAL